MAEDLIVCPACGQPLPTGARFCAACGAALPPAEAQAPAPPQSGGPASEKTAWEERSPAARTAGESALELGGEASGAEGKERPRSGSGLRGLIRDPKTWIPLAALTALWIVLALLKKNESFPVKLLSWLSFAQGGLDRSLPGAIGGALGRGTVAAAWISLLHGGAGNAVKGVAAFFRGRSEKRSVVTLLIGAALGAALYWPVFAGVGTASGATAMAGVSGALLSLEALGGKGGRLYRLAQTLCAERKNGTEAAKTGRVEGLLSGLALGFAVSAALLALL